MWGLKDGFLKFLKTAQKDCILLRVEYQKMMDDTLKEPLEKVTLKK
ncbi:hypothetical protein B4096_0255 [Heyndrickxia coagulans]|nr:hypothetical protein B4096_0255 [Heyndrickxia coagulans]